MSILIDENTRIIVQGITSEKATFHAKEMMEAGSKIVGGVVPGKGGRTHIGLPVFNTVKDAVKGVGAEASITFVAPAFAADSITACRFTGSCSICLSEVTMTHPRLAQSLIQTSSSSSCLKYDE